MKHGGSAAHSGVADLAEPYEFATVDVAQVTHRELADCLQRLQVDEPVRVVVLRGSTDRRFISPFAGTDRDGPMPRPRGGVMSHPRKVYAGLRGTHWVLDSLVCLAEKCLLADMAQTVDASGHSSG